MLLPDGTWVLGPGDTSAEIRKIKAFLRRKFASYAGHLADTDGYDMELFSVVCQVQRNYGLPVTGYIGYSLKVKMGYLKPEPPVRPIIHTFCGTGVPGDVGPDADTGRWLVEHGICDWQWTGYPAAPFPMWSSMMTGINQAKIDINARSKVGTPIYLCGYSQGAWLASLLWKYHIEPPGSDLHHRKDDVKKAFMFCNPMRQEGIGGTPGAGAANDRMVNTPSWWREYANPKDIYASVPVEDGWGENIRAICAIIAGHDWIVGRDSIFAQLLELGVSPFSEGWSAAQAILKAGMFFGSGTGPHVQNLPVGAAIDYLRA